MLALSGPSQDVGARLTLKSFYKPLVYDHVLLDVELLFLVVYGGKDHGETYVVLDGLKGHLTLAV